MPGDFFSEGQVRVGVAVSTHDPVVVHGGEPDVVAFQVVDGLDPDGPRGDYTGFMPGVVRPLLEWTTDYAPAEGSRPPLPTSAGLGSSVGATG